MSGNKRKKIGIVTNISFFCYKHIYYEKQLQFKKKAKKKKKKRKWGTYVEANATKAK